MRTFLPYPGPVSHTHPSKLPQLSAGEPVKENARTKLPYIQHIEYQHTPTRIIKRKDYFTYLNIRFSENFDYLCENLKIRAVNL